MMIFTNWPKQAEPILSKPSSVKKGGFERQWVGDIDMHTVYVREIDQNMLCGSRVMNIFNNC